VASETELSNIYRDTIHPLYAYVSSRTGGHRALAEDIVQEAYFRAWEYWDKRPASNPLAWLKTVARNLLISHYRRIQPGSLSSLKIEPAGEPPDLSRPEAVARLQWGLAHISGSRARLLESFYFDEKRVQAIAEEGKLSVRAVEGRLRRAREALRRQLIRFDKTGKGN